MAHENCLAAHLNQFDRTAFSEDHLDHCRGKRMANDQQMPNNESPAEGSPNIPPPTTQSPGEEGNVAPAGMPGTGEAVCPECRGTGMSGGKECPTCNGTGKVIQGIGGA
jgi:hypothetical protein